MKQSWIVGIVALWIILNICGSIAEMQTPMSQVDAQGKTPIGNLTDLVKAEGTDFSNPLSAAYSIITNVWSYFKLAIKVAFLWYPVLWQGDAQYIWMVGFLAVGVGFVVSVVTIMRGVHTG